MKIKKIFAALLSLAMVLTMLPATAMAADGETTVGSSGVVTNKTATLTDDGTYTINLEAYATGSTTTVTTPVKSGVPLDIILVLDQSGSMSGDLRNLRTAVNSFIGSIEDNAEEYNVDHHIAIVGFAGAEYGYGTSNEYYYANSELFVGSTQYNYMQYGKSSTHNTNGNLASDHYGEAFQSVITEAGRMNLSNSVNALAAKGGTHPEVGFDMVNGIFAANDNTYTDADGEPAERRRIVVMFTDGEPGDNGFDSDIAEETIAEAYATKNTYDATIYTVGLYNNASQNVTKFMNRVSSNYPDAQTFDDQGHYEYTPVYNVNRNNTYYVASDNGYRQVDYYSYYGNWYDSRWNKYTPKTSANSFGTQFYERTWVSPNAPTQVDTKYYMTTNDSSELGNIFTNISEDVTSGSSTTTVTLDAEAVLRDVMANGLVMTDATKITVKTVSATAAVGSDNQVVVTEGSETDTAASVTAQKVDAKTVTVTGFNYSEKYIATGHPGEILKVEITGVIPTEETATDQVIDTNDSVSGIYDKEGKLGATFPEPQTILTSKAYVLDYAKETALTGLDQNTSVTAIVDTMKAVSSADNAVTGTYGNSALSQNSVSYAPKTTNWDGYDKLYVFGKTTNETVKAASANANGNLWSKVSVIPANNVYYEDDFVTDTTSGTVGIVYTGSWDPDGASANNSETANNAVHGGWVENDTGLSNDATYSDGSAQKGTTGATATFTFTGTGVDVYSRTDMTTGTITANLYTGETASKANLSKALIVDNKSASETYYQIPTVSFNDLEYGTYTVKITVTNAAADDGNRVTYYLDGIRVYNPIQDQESDEIVSGAYKDELGAVFTSARDLLQSGSAAFIDEGEDGKSAVGDYTISEVGKLAPENEIYLSKGQSITLKVDTTSGNTYYLGLKAPAGSATTAEITNGSAKSSLAISHSTDLYYKVTPNSDGTIVVTNTGSNLLSITKLRTTGSGTDGLAVIGQDEALNAITAFKTASYVEYTEDTLTEDETTGEETVGEGTVDEDDIVIENPDDSGSQNEDNQTTEENSGFQSWISNLFNGIKNLFSRW